MNAIRPTTSYAYAVVQHNAEFSHGLVAQTLHNDEDYRQDFCPGGPRCARDTAVHAVALQRVSHNQLCSARLAEIAVGNASADECQAAAAAVGFTAQTYTATCSCPNPTTAFCATEPSGDTKQACPAGCQALIDTAYEACDGADGWDAVKPGYKLGAEQMGCGGASQAVPALFVALAALTNHFLN
eukprot:COSAG02_NODE_3797_length_6216_cov_4.330227_2_plen_185_part_00